MAAMTSRPILPGCSPCRSPLRRAALGLRFGDPWTDHGCVSVGVHCRPVLGDLAVAGDPGSDRLLEAPTELEGGEASGGSSGEHVEHGAVRLGEN